MFSRWLKPSAGALLALGGIACHASPPCAAPIATADEPRAADSDPKSDKGVEVRPPNVPSTRIDGLQVVLKFEKVASDKGFAVRFFARVPGDEPSKTVEIPLGITSLLKAPKPGDTETVYLGVPPQKAWIAEQGERVLKLDFEVLPFDDKSEAPQVEASIDEAKVRLK